MDGLVTRFATKQEHRAIFDVGHQRLAVRRATPAALAGVAGRPMMASADDTKEPFDT
jgi:hypothetical protein